MVPYSVDYADYWAGVGFWWDMEFWNKSVDRRSTCREFLVDAEHVSEVILHFDPETGLANRSPAKYVVESDKETRFRISGTPVR